MAKPIPIKSIIKEVVHGLSPADGSNKQNITRALNKALDKKALKHIKLEDCKDSRLIIRVDSSVWLYTLNLQAAKILLRINSALPRPDIKRLVFRIGRV